MSLGLNTLIVSPDTDTVFIGLPQPLSSDSIYIKTNAMGRPTKYLSMCILQQSLYSDPELSTLVENERPKTFQVLYALTGCDYTSFFSGIGKTSFFNSFLKNVRFISGKGSPSGDLSQSTNFYSTEGLLAFIRLVGCVYFDKHNSAFGGTHTPSSLYYSLEDSDDSEYNQHSRWLSIIRDAVWQRI